jgi:hypothetical protein
MSNQGQQYFSYLLRAWREREDSHWRFSLEGVNDKEQVYFASFRSLVAYLAALIQNPRRLIRHIPVELEEISNNTDPIIPEK